MEWNGCARRNFTDTRGSTRSIAHSLLLSFKAKTHYNVVINKAMCIDSEPIPLTSFTAKLFNLNFHPLEVVSR